MKYIMRTCPNREEFSNYLNNKIPNLITCFDKDKDPVGNMKKAFKIAGNEEAIHLEDDAILTDNFIEKSNAIIKLYPEMLIQFFSMRKADLEKGSRIESGGNFTATVCFYTPPLMSQKLLNYFPFWKRWDEHPTGYDLTIADYLKATKQKYFLQCPNLADHRISKSIIGPRRSSMRISKTFKQK